MIELSLQIVRLLGAQALAQLTELGPHVAGNWQLSQQIANIERQLAHGDALQELEFEVAEAVADIAPLLTPVITGSLASSHTPYQGDEGAYVTINTEAINPESDEDPWQYGPKVHEMGGISLSGHRRDFYANLVESYGDLLLTEASDQFILDIGVVR